jgi:hypothetical protein
MNQQDFYRGSRVLAPINHIVMIVLPNGGRHLRRVSLNAVGMAQLECRLIQAQCSGDIRDYLITAAEDCTFQDVAGWIDSLKYRAEQPALLNVQQNSLFGGGL